MAISVDTIYQRVLTLANKEQRGYITPQEFNLLANQAQMSIFESYFYAKNQRDRAEPARTNEVDESDIGELLGAKLNIFRSVEEVAANGGVEDTFPTTVGVSGVQIDVFQTGRVFRNGRVARKVSINEFNLMASSIRHNAASNNEAIYTDSIVTGRDILIRSGGAIIGTGVTVECFRVPVTANWAYVVVSDVALYNSSVSTDFELHRSEEDTLTYSILALAGIVINKSGLAQTASQMSTAESQVQNT
tara:strand:- start:415 stop:1155 length:741 start_codon:yes stop_codon:yes gene_type:complete